MAAREKRGASGVSAVRGANSRPEAPVAARVPSELDGIPVRTQVVGAAPAPVMVNVSLWC
jgi:hypothetical protein